MDENKKLWNKKMDELTVKDALMINIAIPAVMVGGAVIVGAAAAGVSSAKDKIQQLRVQRKLNKITEE